MPPAGVWCSVVYKRRHDLAGSVGICVNDETTGRVDGQRHAQRRRPRLEPRGHGRESGPNVNRAPFQRQMAAFGQADRAQVVHDSGEYA